MAALPPFRPSVHSRCSSLRSFYAPLAPRRRLGHTWSGRKAGEGQEFLARHCIFRYSKASVALSEGGKTKLLFARKMEPLDDSSSLQYFSSVHVRSPQRPSLFPSLVLEMDDVARFSLLRPHPRTHARMREALEGTNGRGAERERGRAEADGTTDGRTDGRGLCYSELRPNRHQERESTLTCCLLLLDSRGCFRRC